MKLNNTQTDSVFVMPKRIAQYLGSAKKSELKLIFYIFSHSSEDFDVSKAAQELAETPESINSALAFWRGTGLITENENEAGEPESPKYQAQTNARVQSDNTEKMPVNTVYTTTQVAEAMQNDKSFKQLVTFTEQKTGELLNSAKTAELLYLYDNLGMECDVIMGIVAHCASVDKTNMRYIVRTAEGIHNDGVRTYKELEAYLSEMKKYAKYESMVKRIIGADNRALTPSEKKYIEKWEKQFNSSKELVTLAYEKTINNTSKPSVQYMSKILESWFADGIKNSAQVNEMNEKKSKQSDKNTAGNFNFDISDIYEKP